MAAIGGMVDKVGNDPVQTGSLLSLLPSIALHTLIAGMVWLGFSLEREVQPPVTVISLVSATVPMPAPSPPAPVVPAPEPEIEPEPLPLPETGMVLPQPDPPQAAPEPVVAFTPPSLPEIESFPFDPDATRPAPPPEPEDAVVLEPKAEEPPKPKAPEQPKPQKKEAQAKPKPAAKPKPKEQTQKATAPAVPAAAPTTPAPSVATTSKTAQAAPIKSAPAATQSAAISDAPIRVTNPTLAGNCPAKYPERARRRNQEGTVILRFLIGTDGKPSDITVLQSSGHQILDEAAQEILAGCAFVPQMRGNRAVTAIADQPIPFKLN